MAKKAPVRRNEQLIRWFRALAFGVLTAGALTAIAFDPPELAAALALGVGVLALFAPGIAVLAAIVSMALPLLAANFLVGAIFLVIGFAAVQYMGQQNGRVFLIVATAFIGAAFGPVWAAAAIAGYLLGASEGAIAAILACLALEGAGIVLGREFLGAVYTGGVTPALVSFANAPTNTLGFGWMSASLEALDPGAVVDAFAGSQGKAMLALQPFLWGAAAAVSGALRRPADDPLRAPFGLVAVGAGVVLLAVGTPVTAALTLGSGELPQFAFVAGSSIVVALAFAAAWGWVFPPLRKKLAAPPVRPGSMTAEDADVDELLRVIAAAEDQLASKHTTHAVVMITDMKSFSKMTEEDGSVTSAKTIQRHRDLLLPVIAANRGHGKSTGGAGLVAAFESPEDAVRAAADMQRTLRSYNAEHEGERDIVIRCGIAAGEVVLDRGGRPFIGAGLNMAARVMNLGDGGQVLTTPAVANAGATDDVRLHSHGLFTLKNIAEPLEVVEVLWASDQTPLELQGTSADSAQI